MARKDNDLRAAGRQARLALYLLAHPGCPRSQAVGALYGTLKRETALTALRRDLRALAGSGVPIEEEGGLLRVSRAALADPGSLARAVGSPDRDLAVRLAVAHLLAERAEASKARDADALHGAAAKVAHDFSNPYGVGGRDGSDTFRSNRLYIMIESSIDGRHLVSCDYLDREGRRTHRVLEPHRIFEVTGIQGVRYLWARDTGGDGTGFKVFRLDRISNVNVMESEPYHLVTEPHNNLFQLPFCIPTTQNTRNVTLTVTMRCTDAVRNAELVDTLGKGTWRREGAWWLWEVPEVCDEAGAASWAVAHRMEVRGPEAVRARWSETLLRARRELVDG